MSRAMERERARAFVGADWDHLRSDSRRRLLAAHRGIEARGDLSVVPWKGLPPSAKAALIAAHMGRG